MHAFLQLVQSQYLPDRPSRIPRPITNGVARLFIVGLACTAIAPASAGTIYWNMQTLAATSSSEPGVAATNLSQGNTSVSGTIGTSPSAGYTFSLDGVTTQASGLNNLHFRTTSGSLSLGTSAFLELALTNNSSAMQLITGFGFGTRSTLSGPQAYTILSSTTSFQTHETLGGGSLLVDSAWAYKTNAFVEPISLAANATRAFRLYAYGGTSSANGNWRIDDLQVTLVPEPHFPTLAGGLAIVSLAAASRRLRADAVRRASRT